MSISTIQNFYKETITRATTLTGATNIYVSALPTPSEGYIVISPSSSTLREIIYYTAKGSDSNGVFITVTLANRGLGGTTAQTHAIGEPVRMNVTAEHIQEISDALDQIVAGGAQDASTTTKGISKLSVAPASATNPIVVGDNDPRLSVLEFGDGSDGDVAISSPTTLTRDMYYDNLTVNSTLTTDGFIVFVKGTLSGNGTIKTTQGNTGGNGSGTAKGAGGTASTTGRFKTTAGTAGGDGNGFSGDPAPSGVATAVVKGIGSTQAGGKGGDGGTGNLAGSPVAGGTGATGSASTPDSKIGLVLPMTVYGLNVSLTGALVHYGSSGQAGGGGGGHGFYQASTADDGGGGGGGGASGGVVFIVASDWSGSFAIEAKGGNGGNGASTNDNGGGGGGGQGGAGGVAVVIYRTKTWTGSYTLTGGSGGTGGVATYGGYGGTNSGTNGSNGATGVSLELSITDIAIK